MSLPRAARGGEFRVADQPRPILPARCVSPVQPARVRDVPR